MKYCLNFIAAFLMLANGFAQNKSCEEVQALQFASEGAPLDKNVPSAFYRCEGYESQ